MGPSVIKLAAISIAAMAFALPAVARAGDPFEIQVYDGTANAPGAAGLELHLNDWVTGQRDSAPPVRPLHGQWHATLEPSYGVLPFWELGLYLQGAVRTDDGAVDWAGAKIRSKFVTPPGWDAHFRLGVNIEVSYLPSAYDPDGWGSEVRPIVAWFSPDWLFAMNPILDQSLAGAGASDGPSFQPALKAGRTLGPVALGFEYYGTLGPLGSPLPVRQQQHYLFGVADLLTAKSFELNVGVGAGLTQASEGVVVKMIVGYSFEPTTGPGEQPLGAAAAAFLRGAR